MNVPRALGSRATWPEAWGRRFLHPRGQALIKWHVSGFQNLRDASYFCSIVIGISALNLRWGRFMRSALRDKSWEQEFSRVSSFHFGKAKRDGKKSKLIKT